MITGRIVEHDMEKGPNTEESAGEIDEDPGYDDLIETVEWAVTTENVEMANIEFEDDGNVGPHIQLLGNYYNLTGLNDKRFKKINSILGEHTDDIELTENAYVEVEIEADVGTHQDLVVSLLEQVYDTSTNDIERLARSTVAADIDRDTTVATCEECGDMYEVEYIMDSFGAEFYGLVDDSGSVGDDAVDMVYQDRDDSWLCKICYDEQTL